MKILHLTRFYPPEPGGLETIVGRLAEGAAARGHDVRVVTGTGSRWVRDPGRRITEPPRRGVVVIRLPTHGVTWPSSPVPLAPRLWYTTRTFRRGSWPAWRFGP